jgi:FemAB-related protein (PEP-CTERM system-associated)
MSGQRAKNARPAVDSDRARWNRLVGDHPDGGYYHLFEWRQILSRSYGTDCRFLVSGEGDQITGVLPLTYMPGRLAGNRLISMPFLDQGGLLATSNESAADLWSAAVDLAEKLGARGIDLRGERYLAPVDQETSRYLFLLPLSEDIDAIWKSLHSKVRNQVRKSEKLGLSTRRAEPEELPKFYSVLSRNMRDLGSPVHGRRFFSSIFEQLGAFCRLYLTEDASRAVVAGGIAIEFGGTVTVPWASALREARPSCPNHSLYWRILCDAAESGAEQFDFGRSTEGTGTYRFKKQWGTSIEPLRWRSFDRQGRPQKESFIDPRKHSTAVELWRHLPLSLTTRIGPWLRGRLPN